MMINRSKLLILLAFLLVSCAPQSEGYITTSPATVMPVEATLTYSPAPTTEVANNDCINLDTTDKASGGEGFVVLQNPFNNKYGFLNLNTTEYSNLQEQNAESYYPYISPNKKYLIGEVCNQTCVYVLSTTSSIVNTISVQNGWSLRQWLDNEHVLIVSLFEPRSFIVLNPFTGDFSNIPLKLNNPYAVYRTEQESFMPVSVDAAIGKVLYFDENFGGRIIMLDINTKQEILAIPFNVDLASRFYPESWSPNYQTYVAAAPDNRSTTKNFLFSFGTDGSFARLTYYDQEFPFANVTYPSWSPDGQHIAFWLKISREATDNIEEIPQYLAIIDLSTMETKVYCITHGPYPANNGMFWNTKGTQIVTNTQNQNREYQPVLIDLIQLTKTNLNVEDRVIGWMEMP